MAEGGIPLEELNRTNPYDKINTLDDLKDIFNDSTYENVIIKKRSNIEEIKIQMTNENFHKLTTLIETKFPNIDKNRITLAQIDLRKRILSKDGDLYLKTTNGPTVKFGKHNYKAIKITHDKGETLNELITLKRNGMSVKDVYYQLLNEDIKETSFIQENVQQIEQINTLRKVVGFAHDDMEMTSTPKPLIQEPIRPLIESRELNNILTDEDRNLIISYLDFVEKNKSKIILLKSDIEFNQKEITKAENQLLTETNEDNKAVLKVLIDKSKANVLTSKQMIDQILAYHERTFENIDSRLKSKFTVGEKLKHIFKKYGLTITAITLALGLVVETIISAVKPTSSGTPPSNNNNNFPDKVKQSLKHFANWLLDMSKKALDNLPAIISHIISFLLKTTASVIGFLAEHLILFIIALAFALYEAIMIGYNDIKRRK